VTRVAVLFLLACGAALAQQPMRPFGPESPAQIARENAGRPYVLALWSTSCEPCIREMPIWKEMQARNPNVRIVLVAADPPQDRERVLAFLARYDPGPVERWQFTGDAEEKLRYAIDPRWRGELPRTYFFDEKHRVEATTGVIERERVERWLLDRSKVVR